MAFSFKKILVLVIFLLLAVGFWYGWRWYKALTATTYEALLQALYVDSVPRLKVANIDSLERFVILDTRLETEYSVSHLPQAHWVNYNTPNWAQLETLDKEKVILVYCSVGYRSERIGEQLLERGFKKVYNLHGGIFEWVNQGRTVVGATGEPVSAVHGYAPRWGKWVTAPVTVQYD